MKKGFWSTLFGSNTGSNSADIAKDRLNTRLTADRIEQMKREILAVVNKYVNGVSIDDLNINHRHEDNLDVLEMNISLPDRK